MDIYGERTVVPTGFREEFTERQNKDREEGWMDITTHLVGLGTSDKKGETLHYQVHTYPTTKQENINHEDAERDKHYVTEVTLNGKWYEWAHDLDFDETRGKVTPQKTLKAIVSHFGVVNTIRTEGPRAFWKRCNPEGGMYG